MGIYYTFIFMLRPILQDTNSRMPLHLHICSEYGILFIKNALLFSFFYNHKLNQAACCCKYEFHSSQNQYTFDSPCFIYFYTYIVCIRAIYYECNKTEYISSQECSRQNFRQLVCPVYNNTCQYCSYYKKRQKNTTAKVQKQPIT